MNAELNFTDYAALSPFLILLLGALVILLVESFWEGLAKTYSVYLTVLTLIAAIIAAYYSATTLNPLLTLWVRLDSLSHFLTIFFLSIGLATTLLSASFFQRFEATEGEYFFLILAALFGLLLIGAAADFLTLFLGLETLSISLYILCGYMKRWALSEESAIKYFLMGAISAAFLLFGIALIYGAVGSTNFNALLPAYKTLAGAEKALFLSGIALVTLGLAFKAAIVPFHVWAPDVYDGAPTPVTAFMAVGTKAGAFAAFAIVFLVALPRFDPIWNEGISLLAYPTLIYANIVALRQTQLRRFFAYSGISHAGFLLLPLAASTPDSLQALMFYLVIYALATLGAFAVIAFLDHKPEGVVLRDLHGLFRRSPLLAGFLALCLLTLAGIPPTAGFFAKFYLFKVAFEAGYYSLVVVGLLMAILAAYYYLRIAAVMFMEAPEKSREHEQIGFAGIVGFVSFAAIVFLSCYPEPLFAFLNARI